MPLPPGSRVFQPEDPFAGRARRLAPPMPGYGIEPDPRKRRGFGNPTSDLEKCIEALVEIQGEVLQTGDLAPWIVPPYRSRRRCAFVRAVINVPAALNAAANAAGLALAAANSTIVPILVLTPTIAPAFTEQLPLLVIQAPASHVVKVESWGIDVLNASDEALEVRVDGSAQGGLPDAPNPFISAETVELHQPADAIITERKPLTISVRNLTQSLAVATPLLVRVSACWWEFPVDRYVDSKEATRLRGGFGVGC